MLAGKRALFFLATGLFTRMDSVARAYLCTTAAIDAYFRIDNVDITGGYCVGRTYSLASATCNAIVVNYVSHSSVYLLLVNFIVSDYFGVFRCKIKFLISSGQYELLI